MKASELIKILQMRVSEDGDYEVVFPVDGFTFATVSHVLISTNADKLTTFVLENIDLMGIYEIPEEYDPRKQLKRATKKPFFKRIIEFVIGSKKR
jgi:hypothetical protein